MHWLEVIVKEKAFIPEQSSQEFIFFNILKETNFCLINRSVENYIENVLLLSLFIYPFGLICYSVFNILGGKIRMLFSATFLFFNICIEGYKFPFKHEFAYIPQILLCSVVAIEVNSLKYWVLKKLGHIHKCSCFLQIRT